MYAIGIDPTESLAELERFNNTYGYTWPVAKPPGTMLIDYRVIVRSTKVAIDGNGIITFREGYGAKSAETWHEVFRQVTST